MTSMHVHLTMVSSNSKTGPIPVTTSPSPSCAPDCPLKDAGCYGDFGPISLHWTKVDKGKMGNMLSWQELCAAVRKFPKHQLWRHNQVGDLPHKRGRIDAEALDTLAWANRERKGFTYSHHKVLGGSPVAKANLEAISAANADGFTVNLSADSLKEADEMAATGQPTVTILQSEGPFPRTTPEGRRVVVCPAYTAEIQCAQCALCAKADRKSIVGFPAHGTRKRMVDEMLATG